MFNLGFTEILVILVLAVIVLGPHRIPEAALRLGTFFRELRKSSNEFRQSIENAVSDNHQNKNSKS